MTAAVIIDAIRTPIGALGAVLASIRPDNMAALVIKEIDHIIHAGSAKSFAGELCLP